jgi:hypothetical protein
VISIREIWEDHGPMLSLVITSTPPW